MARRKGHLTSVEPPADSPAIVDEQAEEIFKRFAGVFEGDGIRVANPSDCARSLLFRAGQAQDGPLFEAMREVIRGKLRKRSGLKEEAALVAEHGHYRRTHLEKSRTGRGRGSGDLKTVR